MFSPIEIIEILKIKLPTKSKRQHFLYSWEKNEIFKFKSAYAWLQQDANSNTKSSIPSYFWSMIWNFKSPERIKMFVWKLIHNKLRTKDILLKKKYVTRNKCPWCNVSVKANLHMIFSSTIILDTFGSFQICLSDPTFGMVWPYPSQISMTILKVFWYKVKLRLYSHKYATLHTSFGWMGTTWFSTRRSLWVLPPSMPILYPLNSLTKFLKWWNSSASLSIWLLIPWLFVIENQRHVWSSF